MTTINKYRIDYRSFDKRAPLYLDIAKRVALESYCERLKVGSIIVNDENILSFGYNGSISGHPNCCEETIDGNLVTLPTVLHSESNAITKACKSPVSTKGATMYCTHSCCVECAKLIIQSGIDTFVYINDYRDTKGIELLLESEIYVIKASDVKDADQNNKLNIEILNKSR
jgi:dCMP deaminase